MKISKDLLQKIIDLRDLRQAISAVRGDSLKKEEDQPARPASTVPYESYKRRYLSGELPVTHIPHNMVSRLHTEGHFVGKPHEEYMSRFQGDGNSDKTEVINRDYVHPVKETKAPEGEGKKPLGLKYLGTKRGYGTVVHMYGLPGHHQHYEVSVNKLSPKAEHHVKLVNSGDGSTVSRSPSTHMDIKGAATDLVNHFYSKKWA